MRHELRSLYAVALAVLVTGLVVGFAFADLSGGAVLVGVVLLACLMFVLFILGRRDESHHSDEDDHQFFCDVR
jgi:hypothetical protein